jgi:hypothetical protein
MCGDGKESFRNLNDKPAMTQKKPVSGESLPSQSSGNAICHDTPRVK